MKNKTNLIIDTLIFIAFLAANNPSVTGIAVHEWLCLAFAFTLLIHLFLHWNWLTTLIAKFFKQLFHQSRLNFVVDLLFFIAMITVMLSGFMISRTLSSVFGWSVSRSTIWRMLHSQSANASLILLAVHFGLHWDWIVSMVKRFVLVPIQSLGKPRQPQEQISAAIVPAVEETFGKEKQS
jgi:hypothetical protein